MRTVRLALVLPTTQLVVATVLLRSGDEPPAYFDTPFVPTPRLICWGLNAPAMLIRSLHIFVHQWEWGTRQVLGFYMDDLFFLVGVIVVWYGAGRALDRRRISEPAGRRRLVNLLPRHLLLLATGCLLFCMGLGVLWNAPYNNPDYPACAILYLVWSAILAFLSGRGILRTLRRRIEPGALSESDSPDR
jgi:hypothetical protein